MILFLNIKVGKIQEFSKWLDIKFDVKVKTIQNQSSLQILTVHHKANYNVADWPQQTLKDLPSVVKEKTSSCK